jgi:hypothetical protein
VTAAVGAGDTTALENGPDITALEGGPVVVTWIVVGAIEVDGEEVVVTAAPVDVVDTASFFEPETTAASSRTVTATAMSAWERPDSSRYRTQVRVKKPGAFFVGPGL